MVRWSIASRG